MKNPLDEWLDAQPLGRAVQLAAYITQRIGHAVSPSYLSQVRLDVRRIQADWMEPIEEFTHGHVTIVQMVKYESWKRRQERSRK